MPHRVVGVGWAVLGLLGAVVLGAMILAGVDAARAARTGPRWKRKLFGAGLILLASLGIGPATASGQAKSGASATTRPAAKSQPLASKQWTHLVATWAEAEEISSGRRGPYPFDKAGKARVLAALATAGKDVEFLAGAGLFSAAEAALLTGGLAELTQGVRRKRPTEMKMATCYKPMPLERPDHVARLSRRLPLLAKLAGTTPVRPEVVLKVLTAADAQIEKLADKPYLATLSKPQRQKAQTVRQQAVTHVKAIRAALAAPRDLTRDATWQSLVAAWKKVAPLAAAGTTRAQRKQADKNFAEIAKAATLLAAGGALSNAEAGLLKSESARMRAEMYRNPPIDATVKCYDMGYMPPARMSLERCTKRLVLLRQIAKRGKVQPAAVRMVLGSIEADLKILADEKQLKPLKDKQRAEAAKVREAVREQVKAIRKLLDRPAGARPAAGKGR